MSLQEYAFSASRLLSVGVGDLADKLGPGHVHGPVHLAGLWSRIILEDLHHQSCVVGQNDTACSMRRSPTWRLVSLKVPEASTAT